MLLRFGEDEIGYFFPDSEKFEEWWDKSIQNPENEYHVMSHLRSVFDWIEVAEAFDEGPEEKIWSLIQDCTVNCSPLLAAGAAVDWETKTGRDAWNNARAGVRLLDLGLQNAIDRNWVSVAVFCLKRRMALEGQFSTLESSDLEDAVELIELVCNDPDPHLGNLSDLVQLFLENEPLTQTAEKPALRAIVLCVIEANRLRDTGQLFQERDILRDCIELADLIDVSSAGLQARYVDNYRRNAEQQSLRGPSLEASEWMSGLEDDIVQSFLSDDAKKRWKKNLRSAVQKATKELRENGATIDTTRQEIQRRTAINSLADTFKHIKWASNTETALFWLLTRDQLIPKPLEDEEAIGISDIISRVSYASSGHLTQFDPKESDLPASYAIQTQISMSMTVSVIDVLRRRGHLTEIAVLNLLWKTLDHDDDTNWYLEKFVEHLFDDNHTEAIHIAMPRLESLLYSLLLEKGEDVDALMDAGTGHRTLGSLLGVLQEYISEDYHQYLEYVYNDPVGSMFGGNLRNRVAHGHLKPGENTPLISYLLLVDILRIIVRLQRSKAISEYGLPVILPRPGQTPFVLRSYHSTTPPSDSEVIEFLNGGEKSIEEIANHFKVPRALTYSLLTVLDEIGKIELQRSSDPVKAKV